MGQYEERILRAWKKKDYGFPEQKGKQNYTHLHWVKGQTKGMSLPEIIMTAGVGVTSGFCHLKGVRMGEFEEEFLG